MIYREMIMIYYKNDFGHPNMEFNHDAAVYGIVYKISEKNFYKIVNLVKMSVI